MSFFVILVLLSTLTFVKSKDKNFITVAILQTGNSDCIIIKTPENAIMIDTALEKSYDTINKKLQSMDIKKLDSLIITHYDKDHIGSAARILENYSPEQIYVTYERPKVYSNAHKNYIETVDKLNLNPTIVRKVITLNYGEVRITIYPPKSDYYVFNPSNNSSLVVSLEYYSTSFLFAADIEKERIAEILNSGVGEYDVMKVPHHGWFESNSQEFFNAVSPKYSVVTNSYKFRKIEATVSALAKSGSYVYSTSNGEVVFNCYENYVAVAQQLI